MHIVGGHIVLIHQHIVAQQLVRRGTVQLEAWCLIAYVQGRVQHVAFVAARIVGVHLGGVARGGVGLAIGKPVLARILVVGQQVGAQSAVGSKHQPQACPRLVLLVGAGVQRFVTKKTVAACIEGCHAQCPTVVQLAVVGRLGVAPQVRAYAQLHVGALISEGVARVNFHQSALGVLAVQRALRTAQHVYTLGLVEVHIVGCLAHQRHAVEVDAHRWVVDARANATNIH